MPRPKHKDNLLEIVEDFLQRLGQPLHYKQISDLLIETEMWDGRSNKNPSAILYTALHTDIVEKGWDSAFRMMEGGIFCASTIRCIDQVCTPPETIRQNRKPRNPEVIEQKKLERLEDATLHQCGSCKFLKFVGIEITRMTRGSCKQFKISGRVGVGIKEKSCIHYKPRTQAQINKDIENRDRSIIKAADVTAAAQKKRK